MKKIFKKLCVIALIIAVLAPFIEVPSVKAESCSEHLQNYLFLDVNILYHGIYTRDTNRDGKNDSDPVTLFDYYKDGRSINTTIFPYEFPIGENVNVTNVEFNQLDESDSDIENYIKLHNKVIAWTDDEEQDNYRSYNNTEIFGGTFVSNPADKYDSSAILLHGQWSSLSEKFEPIENNWEMINNSGDSDYPFARYVLQATPLKGHMETIITEGEVDEDGNAVPADGTMDEELLNTLVETDLEELYNDKKLDYMNDVDKYFIPVTIQRTLKDSYSDDDLDDAKFGYVADNTLYVFGTTKETENISVDDVTGSYEEYKKFILAGGDGVAQSSKYSVIPISSPKTGVTSEKFNEDPTDYDVDFNVYASYYWPFVLTVEYEMCSYEGGGGEDGGSWTLEYHGNDKNAKNVPDGGDFDYGEEVVLEDGPQLKGYSFREWCTEPDGSGDCYEAGETYIGPDTSTTIDLWAQWGKTGKEDTGDTGVFSYILSFLAVGAVAGTIYFISKKKNLFKQV